MDISLIDLINNLPTNFKNILNNKTFLDNITNFLISEEKRLYPLPIYPKSENIFRAFSYNNIEQIKVVIIGQDCYHGENQAIGLCFGVNNNTTIPPSLRNIAKEIKNDIGEDLTNTSLETWAKQGVLLLNSALTVHKNLPGSHLKIWQLYTDKIIKELSLINNNTVFLLWGNYAKQKKKIINKEGEHYILESSHPSPLSANRGGWFGNNHFTMTNNYLISKGKEPIRWT